jgi:hypothetical protein
VSQREPFWSGCRWVALDFCIVEGRRLCRSESNAELVIFASRQRDLMV